MSASQHYVAPANPIHMMLSAKHRLCLAMAVVFGLTASGCGQTTLYNWGHYEKSLQDNYVAHTEAEAYSNLEATITAAQQTGGRIPPGVCAEYGFLLYKRGQHENAIKYFQQEAQLFPESKPLMDRLAAKVREKTSLEEQPPVERGIQ